MIYVLYIKCTVYKVRDHQEVCLDKGKVFHDFQLIKLIEVWWFPVDRECNQA